MGSVEVSDLLIGEGKPVRHFNGYEMTAAGGILAFDVMGTTGQRPGGAIAGAIRAG